MNGIRNRWKLSGNLTIIQRYFHGLAFPLNSALNRGRLRSLLLWSGDLNSDTKYSVLRRSKMGSANDITDMAEKKNFTVAIEGNIGSGKTSFLQYFSQIADVQVVYEPVEEWRCVDGHNVMDMLYRNPKKYGYLFQTLAQLTMFKNHLVARTKPVTLLERSMFSARYCFVENLYRGGMMEDVEKVVLNKWFDSLCDLHKDDLKIDLIVYLRTKPEVVHERVMRRGRPEEATLTIDFVEKIHNLHDEWLLGMGEGPHFSIPAPVLVLDANQSLSMMKDQYEKHSMQILGRVTSSGLMISPPLGETPSKQQTEDDDSPLPKREKIKSRLYRTNEGQTARKKNIP